MNATPFPVQAWNGRYLRVIRVGPEERERIIREALASRAFQISEGRGFELGHDLEDWQRAEKETLRPLNCGFLLMDRKMELNTDANFFDEGGIDIYVEPMRLTICGPAHAPATEAAPQSARPVTAKHVIVRQVDLPHEIDPSGVTARFNGRFIEVGLPMARLHSKVATVANAA